jgi:hypothetical protein
MGWNSLFSDAPRCTISLRHRNEVACSAEQAVVLIRPAAMPSVGYKRLKNVKISSHLREQISAELWGT